MTVARLKPFLFLVVHRDGTTSDAIFYALTAAEATRLARRWAQRTGHRRVELVEDEVAA